MQIALLIYVSFVYFLCYSQSLEGRVFDASTGEPLPFAIVHLTTLEDSVIETASTDTAGYFRISAEFPGRYLVKAFFYGYESVIREVTLYYHRVTIVQLGLKPALKKLPTVIVRPEELPSDKPVTNLSRTRFYSIQTLRYAGTLGDVIRTVQILPQVYTISDMRNDLVVRGNTPWGVLYRIEDIDVPSPNHFSEAGMSAGPVSILNNNVISQLDFYAGAFSAEYVGAYSAAFDISLRQGSYSKHQALFQVGWTGVELQAEGPIKRSKRSSYLISYRYSFLDFLKLLGVKFGTAAVPRYQDLSFNVTIPGAWETRVWGVGGISSIHFEESIEEDQQGLTVAGMDLLFSTRMGAIGIRTKIPVPKPAYMSVATGLTHSAHLVKIQVPDSNLNALVPRYENRFTVYTWTSHIKGGLSLSRIHIRAGLLTDHIMSSNIDSVYTTTGTYQTRNFSGSTQRVRFYIQSEVGLGKLVKIMPGVATLYHALVNRASIDPRVSVQVDVLKTLQLRAGYALISTDFPLPVYQFISYDQNGNITYPYRNLPFMKAHHAILEVHYQISRNWSVIVAGYKQWLFNIPVDGDSVLVWWSLITEGLDYGLSIPVDNPVPKGYGSNIGIEFTLQRRFTRGTYALFTLSLFDSKYTGIDGKWYNTPFNGNFVTNLLAGTEFELSKKSGLTGIIDVRLFFAGGKRIHPIDTPATYQAKEIVWDYSNPFSEKIPNYFRLDLKVGLRLPGKKVTQEWLLYMQNVTNHRNIYSYQFSMVKNEIIPVYQMGFIPVMLYRLLF